MGLNREFILPADAPIRLAARRLFEFGKPRGFDLSGCGAILPTRSAGRALNCELFRLSRECGAKGVFGLSVYTPESFLSEFIGGRKAANQIESVSAWIEVFSAAGDADMSALFPLGKPDRRDYLSLAHSFSKLRRALAEIGHDINSVLEESCVAESFDAEKWRQAARLEGAYKERLKMAGLIPPEGAVAAALEDFKKGNGAFDGLKELFVFGLCEVSKIFEDVLRAVESAGTEVFVGIFADCRKCGAGFDDVGRPNEFWDSFEMPISDEDIFVGKDIDMQANMIARAVADYGENPERKVCVACAEDDSAPILAGRLEDLGVSVEMGAAVPVSKSSQLGALRTLARYMRTSDMEDFSELLRNSSVLSWAARKLNCSESDILKSYDAFVSRKFPISPEAALSVARRGTQEWEIFGLFESIIDRLRNSVSAALALGAFCENFVFANGDAQQDVEDFFKSCLQMFESADAKGLKLDCTEAFEEVARISEREYRAEEFAGGRLQLLDWMDIFWAQQAHVFFCDMNAGIVPSANFGAFILTDGLSGRLGISNSAQRRRRDAYMFYAMLESRKGWGKCTAFVPRTRGDGSAVQPSPLLSQCCDEKLAGRVERIYSGGFFDKDAPVYEAAWKLKVPYAELPKHLSPSAFKAYLTCPFRFYLERVLGLKMFEASEMELNAADFGTLIHSVLENFGKSEKADSTDESEIKRSFFEILDERFGALFGRDVSAPLLFQRESAREILASAARAQAEHALEGWRILDTELEMEMEINSYPVKMRVDRVDEHPDGTLMAVDYKVKNSFSTKSGMSVPESYHRKRARNGESGQALEWIDLQLPIYKRAIELKYPSKEVCCAYFALPSDGDLSGICRWDIDADTMDSAMGKASEIVGRIRARDFAPSKKMPSHDAWKEFFPFADADLADYLEFLGGRNG